MADEPVRVFSGRVHPERANVNISIELVHLKRDGNNATVHLSVHASQVLVRLVGELGLELGTLKNAVQELAAAVVDTLGFTNGCGYTVEITSQDGPEGGAVFGVDVPALHRSPMSPPADFPGIVPLLLHDPGGAMRPLRRALADFRQAILSPSDTPFHCFRAVEALMFHFGRNVKKGRPEMCRRLRIEDRWLLERLEKPAGEIRHGKVVAVSDEERFRALFSARSVIERFIILKQRQLEELPAEEFPLLTTELAEVPGA